MKNNVGMTSYIMTREKVEKQGRDDHCELSHKTALYTYRVVGPNNSTTHKFLFPWF